MLEEYVQKAFSHVVSTSPPKWLNIVLDINGILYYCMEKVATNNMPFVNDVRDGIHSSKVPTMVKPKAVFMSLDLFKFFIAISKFVACLSIWSSMKRSIVEQTVNYFFCGLPLLFEILGLDSCQKIETSHCKYLIVISGSKEIFLKNLSEALFIGSTCINRKNIILIDNNPKKYMCNDNGNYPFFQTWTSLAIINDFFLGSLAPWLFQLMINCNCRQFRNFVNRNQIRMWPLAT